MKADGAETTEMPSNEPVAAEDVEKSSTTNPTDADDASADAEDTASADADTSAGAGTDADLAPARRRLPLSRRVVAVTLLIVIAVAGVAAAAVFGWKWKNATDIDDAGRAAQRAAEHYAIALTSIDSGNLDRDFATVLDGATGEFKDMYGQSSGQLKQLLIDNKATGHGTVVDSAVKSASADRVEVLLFVDQTVTNTAHPDPRVDRSRIVMTMQRVDGRWLAAKVALP